MKPTKVAVTGATGQVGAALVRRLHDEGVPVVAAVRNELGAALVDAETPGCEIRIGSLTPDTGAAHLLDDCDVVVNCALASSGGNPRQAYARNRQLVDGLLQARSLRWLVHFSTVAVYGELIRAARDAEREFASPPAASEYGRSKLDVERYALERCRARGVQATVLRLGHVYGAGIWRSREIVELSRDPEFRLPFDGRFQANTIRTGRLTSALLALLDASAPPTLANLVEPEASWRDVFDWHTAALGLAPVTGMSEEESRAERGTYENRSVPRDVATWVRGLPVGKLVRSPATFDLALRVLAKTPEPITKRVTGFNRRVGARGHVARAARPKREILGPLYYSEGVPGPSLPLGSSAATDERDRRELIDWCELWSTPRLDFTSWASRGASVVG